MTTPKMTRKKALEKAQELFQKDMHRVRADVVAFYNDPDRQAEYAELAAALAYIEHMARQKEMHL